MKNKRLVSLAISAIGLLIIFILFSYFFMRPDSNIADEPSAAKQNPSTYDVSKLEALYESNPNYRTLELIVQNYEPQTDADYEKLILYYEKLFETADADTTERNQNGYVDALYKAEQKQKYYETVNRLLNENEQTKGIDSPKKMSKAVLLLYPILNSPSQKSDFEFALNKLYPYDNADTLIDFHDTYTLYSAYCKLFYKLGDVERLNIFKNKIIDKLNRELKSDPILKESKNSIIDELNTFIYSK